MRSVLMVILLGMMPLVWAAKAPGQATSEAQLLPSPLTLEQVLALADQQPVEKLALLQQQAALKAAMEDAKRAKAFTAAVKGLLGAHQFAPDYHRYHQLQIQLQKTLWDNGRTEALLKSLQGQQHALEVLNQDALNRYRLRVIEAFFNIILADTTYRMLNEEMAVRYVLLDRARDHQALGSVSDVTLAKLEKDYRILLVQRNDAELLQRQRRTELAILLDKPYALFDEVAPPRFKAEEKLPDLEVLFKRIEAKNPRLQALALQKQALLQKLTWARKQNGPSLSVQASAGPRHYENEPDKDAWDVNLALSWPLVDGGVSSTRQAEVQAALMKLRQQEKQLRQQLLQQAVDSWRVLSAYPAKEKWLKAYQDFVDLNMEYKRGLYENEERTNIGDAMIEQSKYELNVLKTTFERMLNYYRLKLLQGEQVP